MRIEVAYNDLKEKMVKLINEAQVPMFMKRDLLIMILDKVSDLAKQELNMAMAMQDDARDRAMEEKLKEAEDQSEQKEEEVSR